LWRGCGADDRTATLDWTKVDGEISADVIADDGTLIIPYVSAAHQGTYRCTTTTVTGASYMQFILTVEGTCSLLHHDPHCPPDSTAQCCLVLNK